MGLENVSPDFEVTKPDGARSKTTRKAGHKARGEYVTTPQALGRRLLDLHQHRILIVRPGTGGVSGWGEEGKMWGESVAYLLDTDTGLWNRTPDPWRDLVVELLDTMDQDARRSLGAQAVRSALQAIHRAQRSTGLVKAIRLNLAATAELASDQLKDLTWCTADELNSDMRYLGCANGVVDLDSGQLLSPEDGRKHLVTHTTGVDFVPRATHDDVERLFCYLEPEQVEWYLEALGHALHGRPSRRIYLIVGEKGGGKTLMAQALLGALGEYAKEPMDSALTQSSSSGQHNTELADFASPTRVCIMDELNVKRVSPALLKRLSGDGRITFRRLHENPQTRPATATLIMVANPGSVPRLHLEDEALVDRMRELPYATVPEKDRDPALRDRLKTQKSLEAFLAKLIGYAAKVKPGHPPKSIPSVRRATTDRIAEDLGEFGSFARRLRPASGERLSVQEVWEAWCAELGLGADAKNAGGVKRGGIARRLRSLIPNLPKTTTIKVDGKVIRGWKGWRLTDGEEDSS